MTYANERICWDADSHLMPETDFLSKDADPRLRDALQIAGGRRGGKQFEQIQKMVEAARERRADHRGLAGLRGSSWCLLADRGQVSRTSS